MPRDEGRSFGSFSIPSYRALFVGTMASFTAFFMSTAVQGVVAFELLGTNRAVGSAVFGQGLGMLLLSPIGGAYADRLPKRRVVALGQIASASVFAVLALLYASERLVVAHLVAGSFVIGGSFAFLGPARQAMVVDLVPLRLRGNAMALNNVANTLSRVIGPSLAALLLAHELAGPTAAFSVMTLLYLSSAAMLLLLPRSVVREDVDETHVFEDLSIGLRYVWHHRRLRQLLFFFMGVLLLGFPHISLMPGLLENELGRPAVEVTTLYSVSALGALCVAVVVARFADAPQATLIYSAMAAGFGLSLGLLAWAPSFSAAVGATFVIGATSGGFHALNGAVIARRTEPVYMGRVMSLSMLAFAGFGLTALPIGLLADIVGERRVLLGMGIAVLVLALRMGLLLLQPEPGDARAGREGVE
jgi:predicted MFS family arabinose efflux permease